MTPTRKQAIPIRAARAVLRRFVLKKRVHRAHLATRRLVRRLVKRPVHRAYLEDMVDATHNWADVRWLGHPIWQNVLDLWVIQEIISQVRPALLIETGTHRGGSALFYAHMFDLLGNGRVITIDVKDMEPPRHGRVEHLLGGSTSPEIVETVSAAANEVDGPVMVILDSDHSATHVAAELQAYAPLVSRDSYLIVQDGVVDTLPHFSAHRPGPSPAIEDFLQRHPEFEVDERRDAQFLTTYHPRGWLRRVSESGFANEADVSEGERVTGAQMIEPL